MSITKISPDVVDFDAGITISTADNTDTLTLTSTDADANAGPNLRMYRNSSSPADADVLGQIDYEGRNDNSQDVVYARITVQANDVSDGSEDGSYYLSTMVGGTLRNRMNVLESETVFNQESLDLDFRIESNDSVNMLVVDGGNNKVLIEGQNTDTVSNAATMIAAGVLEINGNAGEGSDHIKMGAMADGTGDQFIEATNSGATSAYRLMINPVNGGNLYSGGNLELASAKGIIFDAVAGGATSNTLDDYEEGSFTIGVSGTTATLGNTTAYYTKIGRLVYFFWYSGASTFASSSGNTAGLSGFPFYQDGLSTNYGLFQYLHGNAIDGNSTGGYINNNGVTANFIDGNGFAGASFIDGSTKYIMVQGIYQTDA